MRWSDPESISAPCSFWPPGTLESVFEFFDFRPHGAQVARDQGDAIAFLHAQLPGIADADSAAGVGRDRREHRQFVDEPRGQRSRDLGRA